MRIITLTTDMGFKDHYVAALKGKLFSLAPEAKVIDISHSVKPFNISQAAYFIESSVKNFPEGSIHVIGVDPEPLVNFSQPEKSSLPIIMKAKGQYFVGTDNGIFSLLLRGNDPEELWAIDDVLSQPELMKFPTKNILVPAACRLANGEDPKDFASVTEGYKKAFRINPVIDGHTLKGSIIHVDHYGNLITNIRQDDFYRLGRKIPFVIYFRQKEYYIDEIALGYNEVPPGEKVAIFNDEGLLEIAINKGTPENGGGANMLFGLGVGDVVRIEFMPRGSRETLSSLF